MRESKAYLLFFKKNFTYFLIGSVLFTTLGVLVQLQKPVQYNSSILLEINSPTETVNNKVSLVQEAVTLARSQNVQSAIGANSKIAVFNNSPLTVTIESVSADKVSSLSDLQKVNAFLKSKFSFDQIGSIVTSIIYPNFFLGALIGFALGNLLVVSVLLVSLYVKEF